MLCIILYGKILFLPLDFVKFSYATLDFDISLLPLLVCDNYHNCHSVRLMDVLTKRSREKTILPYVICFAFDTPVFAKYCFCH